MNGSRAVTALVLIGSGCDVVLGLDPPVPKDAADVPSVVRGRVVEKYATNTPSFTPMVEQRFYPVGAIAFAVRLDDGSQPDVDYDAATGAFSFPVAREGQRYRIVFNADGNTSAYEHTTDDLRVTYLYMGRPDRLPHQTATLRLDFPPFGMATSFAHVVTTGLWSFTSSDQYGPQAYVDWKTVTPVGGSRLGMLEQARNDLTYVLELANYSAPPLGSLYTAIRGVAQDSLTLLPGGLQTVGPPQVLAHDRCVWFSTRNATSLERVRQTTGRMYRPSAHWLLDAMPDPLALGVAGSLWVAAAGFQTTAPDLELVPTFGNPYPGYSLVVEGYAVGTFDVLIPGTTIPYPLSDDTRRYQPIQSAPASGCAPSHVALDSTIGIAGRFSVGGDELVNDGQRVSIDRSRDVPVTWELVEPGPVHMSHVVIHELRAVGNSTTIVKVDRVNVASPSVSIDPALLIPGRYYNIAVSNAVNFPNAPAGDFETLALPFESSTTWSRFFELAN